MQELRAAALVFFILGCIVKAVLNRFLSPEDEKKSESGDNDTTTDNNETEDNK